MTALNRRQFVTAAAAAGVALTGASPARAQTSTKFTIISHRVHQQTLTEGPAGNVIPYWAWAQRVRAGHVLMVDVFFRQLPKVSGP